MTSATSMTMEQAVMPMGTTKYNHRHQSFYQTYRPPYFWTRYRFSLLLQNIGLHTSGQDIDFLYFCKILASILLEQDMIQYFTFKYRHPLYGEDIRSFKTDSILNDQILDSSSMFFVIYAPNKMVTRYGIHHPLRLAWCDVVITILMLYHL